MLARLAGQLTPAQVAQALSAGMTPPNVQKLITHLAPTCGVCGAVMDGTDQPTRYVVHVARAVASAAVYLM